MKAYTITELAEIPINDRHVSIRKIRRVIATTQLPPTGTSPNGFPTFGLDEFKTALKKYNKEKVNNDPTHNPELAKLKQAKLTEEIARLKQEKERADLEIAELKNYLIPAEDVKDYLLMRQGVENAILRRVLFVNAPVELTGLDIIKARTLCEDYFNMIQDVMSETLALWQSRLKGPGEPRELPEGIKEVIKKLDDALNKETAAVATKP